MSPPAAAEALNPLVASYGRALVDRAALDALLKLHGTSVFAGMRGNIGGLAPHAVAPDLAGFDFPALLAGLKPARRIAARHTVGLVDPITAADQSARVADGLPETLEEVAATYGHTFWKLKVMGDVAQDVDRLCRIAAVIDSMATYHVSLDGNEQYEDAEGAAELWHAMEAEPRLARLCASVLYIEQPVKRARALETSMHALARESAPSSSTRATARSMPSSPPRRWATPASPPSPARASGAPCSTAPAARPGTPPTRRPTTSCPART